MPNSVAVSSADAPAAKATKRSLKKNVVPSEFGGPQMPKNGFMLFTDEKRPGVLQSLRQKAPEGEPVTKLAASATKEMGGMWKTLDEASKKVYQDKAAQMKLEHTQATEAWKKTDQYKAFLKECAVHKKKKADKKAKDTLDTANPPKKPSSGYFLFSMEVTSAVNSELQAKAADAKVTMGERAAEVKKRWTALGEAGQKVYQDRATEAKTKYEAEMATFKETDAWKAYQKALEKNRKDYAEGLKLAKNGGVASKKRGATSSTAEGPDAKKSKGDGEASSKVFDSDDEEKMDDEAEDEEDDEAEEEGQEEEA